jgi:hypothetical protein
VSSLEAFSWPAPVENKANKVRTAHSQICAIGEICGALRLRLSRTVTLLLGSAYDVCGAAMARRGTLVKVAWFCVAVLALLAPSALSEMRMISLEEARKLVWLALPQATRKLPGLTLVPDERPAPPCRCRTFDILWSNPGPGSVHSGFYAVDLRTGEVWTPMLCNRVTNRALKPVQRAIRKRLGVTELEYRQALKPPPRDCCANPDVYIKRGR